MKTSRKVVAAAGGAGALAALYTFAIRPWHTTWGTTVEDLHRAMPLDDAVASPNHVTNRAIEIAAYPDEVWPWLVQMGELPRGGFYSYESVERLLGMSVRNADTILPEFQTLAVGDRLDRDGNLLVKAVDPIRHLVLGPPPGIPSADVTWAIALYPVGPGRTRVVSRIRARITPNLRSGFWFVLLDPGQFLMERRWLLGLRERAEMLARSRPAKAPSPPATDPVPEKLEPAVEDEFELPVEV